MTKCNPPFTLFTPEMQKRSFWAPPPTLGNKVLLTLFVNRVTWEFYNKVVCACRKGFTMSNLSDYWSYLRIWVSSIFVSLEKENWKKSVRFQFNTPGPDVSWLSWRSVYPEFSRLQQFCSRSSRDVKTLKFKNMQQTFQTCFYGHGYLLKLSKFLSSIFTLQPDIFVNDKKAFVWGYA